MLKNARAVSSVFTDTKAALRNNKKARMALFLERHTCEVRRIPLLKLSEKSRMGLWRYPTDHRNALFGAISSSVDRPNSRLERCSNHSSDSFSRYLGERKDIVRL